LSPPSGGTHPGATAAEYFAAAIPASNAPRLVVAEYFATAIPSSRRYFVDEIPIAYLTATARNFAPKTADFAVVAPAVSQMLTVHQKNFQAAAQVFPIESVS
jgi:hypothetical protein